MKWLVRLLWCSSIVVCSTTMMYLGEYYPHPLDAPIPRPAPWPARAVEGLWNGHLVISALATASARRVWGQYWWVGWLAVGAALAWTGLASIIAGIATSGLYF